MFVLLVVVGIFKAPYSLHKEDSATTDKVVRELEAKITLRPDIQSRFIFEKTDAVLEVTNTGPGADVWAPMRIEGMMKRKLGDAFARWTHTEFVKTRIAKGQTCRLRIAFFEVNNLLGQWVVYSTTESGPAEDRPISSVLLGNSNTQTQDIHIYVDLVSDPDTASGIKSHHIVLHSRHAEAIQDVVS
jgi:hypothetical protein